MLHTTRGFVLTVALASAGRDVFAAAQRPPCLMEPPRLSFTLPERGFVALDGDAEQGPCEPVPAESWVRASAGTTNVMAYADGPGGSGRYWTVTVGVAPRQQVALTRGLCLETTTLGWRTLQRFNAVPLRWIDDADSDGRPELVLWASFPLTRDASAADFAIVAWVYEFDGTGTFAIDWALSRRIARDLVVAYRTPLDGAQASLKAARSQAARQLQAFVEGACAQPVAAA